MATYRLDESESGEKTAFLTQKFELDDKILLSNVHWFISVRWIIVFIFVLIGLSGKMLSESFVRIGFSFPVLPLVVMALLLLLINITYFLITRKLGLNEHNKISTILWMQIIVDLIFVTALVYYIGCTDTFISFIYLIHIALSCVFFPRSKSILVVSISVLFYISCVLLQNTGMLAHRTIFISTIRQNTYNPTINILFAVSAIFIWFVLWYFISTLSEGIRERDSFLRIANEELQLADKEKTQKVIVTTHDLKAPFVGIESNINVLKYLHWDELPDQFREIIDKIESRSKTLRERINKILELGNLRIEMHNDIEKGPVDLKKIFDEVIGDVADQILEKKIKLITEIKKITINSNEEKLKILFSNLVSNAVFYTPGNGEITIVFADYKDMVNIIIKDSGIGIDEKYLDKIFDEYFRTPDARRFNKMSTGLGLKIVKTVVEQLSLSIEVESEKNIGTTFIVELRH